MNDLIWHVAAALYEKERPHDGLPFFRVNDVDRDWFYEQAAAAIQAIQNSDTHRVLEVRK